MSAAPDDFERIRKRLADWYEPNEIEIWLRSPHPMLGGEKACDLINAGRTAEIDRILNQLDDGVYI